MIALKSRPAPPTGISSKSVTFLLIVISELGCGVVLGGEKVRMAFGGG
jgi:hypothetical protein